MTVSNWRIREIENAISKKAEQLSAKDDIIEYVFKYFETIGYDIEHELEIDTILKFFSQMDISLKDSLNVFSFIRGLLVKEFYINLNNWTYDGYLEQIKEHSNLEKDKKLFIEKDQWDKLEYVINVILKEKHSDSFALKSIVTLMIWYGVPNNMLSKVKIEEIEIIGNVIFVPNKTATSKQIPFFKVKNKVIVDFIETKKHISKGYIFRRVFFFSDNDFKEYPIIKDYIGELNPKRLFMSGSFYRYKIEKSNQEELFYPQKKYRFYFKTMAEYLYGK